MTVVRFPITNGFVFINKGDVPLVSKMKWWKVKSKRTFYARGKIVRNGKRTSVNMQNFLMGCPKQPVDHKDRNGLNNVRRNLRIMTHFENLQNCSGRGGTSKFKGVSLFYRGQKRNLWRVVIGGGHVGLYYSEVAAAKAYDAAALKRFGPTAFQNTLEYRL